MTKEAIEKIEAISSTDKKIAPVKEPNKAQFDALMEQELVGKGPNVVNPPKEETQKISVMEQMARTYSDKYVSDATLLDVSKKYQANAKKIEEVKTTLQDVKTQAPQAEIPLQYRERLTKKLGHINEAIKVAETQVGVEFAVPGETKTSLATPIDRFLNMLSNAQYQISNLGGVLKDMAAAGNQVSPAQMLALQIKANQISQQIEFFSNLLNKALEGVKTTMNIQV